MPYQDAVSGNKAPTISAPAAAVSSPNHAVPTGAISTDNRDARRFVTSGRTRPQYYSVAVPRLRLLLVHAIKKLVQRVHHSRRAARRCVRPGAARNLLMDIPDRLVKWRNSTEGRHRDSTYRPHFPSEGRRGPGALGGALGCAGRTAARTDTRRAHEPRDA